METLDTFLPPRGPSAQNFKGISLRMQLLTELKIHLVEWQLDTSLITLWPPVASSLLLFPEDWLVRLCLQSKCNLENSDPDRSEKSNSEERRDTKSHAVPLHKSHSKDLSLHHPGAVLPSSPPSLRSVNIIHAHLAHGAQSN